ncbi:hypothetical protein NEMBOFW57_008149 [Staphylotrichum longicolle]|uniref:Uncharacterized protein n=1 Tax=Staphylotrichum longicolle TaxID=669026 RepID=A0AAD4HWW9_9PEZI|nr:hypothetical protein NEMBOFW57_008149 [Staphylotrichum longicolle]
MAAHQVAIPLRLEAFVLNEAVVDSGLARIAPLSQPNFTGIQLDPISPAAANVPEFQSWIVESDKIRHIGDFISPNDDLEVDCVPFLHADDDDEPGNVVKRQAEVFLGQTFDALKWTGDDGADSSKRANLSVLASSNALMTDYQPFNSSVFSLVDNFSYVDGEGDTPMDALLAYLKSLPKPTDLELALTAMQNLLIKQADGVDVQQEAADLLHRHNYASSSGGTWYTPSGPNGGSKFSSVASGQETPLEKLNDINIQQRALNTMLREQTRLQWDLFAEWWKAIGTPRGTHFDYTMANNIVARLLELGGSSGAIATATSQVTEAQGALAVLLATNTATDAPFYCSKDPTILLAGCKSPWPPNYADALQVRLGTRVVTDSQALSPVPSNDDPDPSWSNLSKFISQLRGSPSQPRFPLELTDMVFDALLLEFRAIRPLLDSTGAEPIVSLKLVPDGSIPPAYHHSQDDTTFDPTGLDRWLDTQPFLPLFIEWEGQYYHIDFDDWDLQTVAASSVDNTTTGARKIEYGIPKSLAGGDPEVRVFSGRTLVLPQSSLSLEQSVDQIVRQTPPNQLPPEVDRKEIVNAVRQLPVLSATLSGFTDHLRTELAGTHVKPIVRQLGQPLSVLDSAVIPNTVFTKENILLMGQKTGKTPYGTLVHTDPTKCPFKPVTHGQFKFTKLNIVDKFGQVVTAIDPEVRRLDGSTTKNRLFPCVADGYKPQTLPDGSPKPVEPDDPGKCSFIQLSPRINQDARVNAHIVVQDGAGGSSAITWRPASEWEDQAVGWLLLNNADYGIQFFQKDGTFYREIRKGGPWPKGETVSKKWLPFEPPPSGSTNAALDRFIAQLEDDKYLDAMIFLLEQATADLQHTPNEYSGYLQSLIGRPFALVNMGWSLELANRPLHNQAMGTATQPPPYLLPPSSARKTKESHGEASDQYSFPIKLGDKDRSFDGLVCYFDTDPSTNDVDYSKITYYDDESVLPYSFPPGPAPGSKFPRDPSNAAPFPSLSPFYAQANDATSGPDVAKAYNSALKIFGGIVDPFSAVHGYTGGLLPVKALQFPHWFLEKALRSMTFFFQAGPLLVAQDVASTYSPAYQVSADPSAAATQETVPGHEVAVPAVSVGEWTWMQPYVGGNTDAYGLAKTTDGAARFEKAPYTAIQGYMQLRSPLTKEPARNVI